MKSPQEELLIIIPPFNYSYSVNKRKSPLKSPTPSFSFNCGIIQTLLTAYRMDPWTLAVVDFGVSNQVYFKSA